MRADVGRDLADELLIGAADDQTRGCLDRERDAVGRDDRYGMREANGQLDVLSFRGRAVADALDLEHLREAFGYAVHHVRDQRTGKAVERAMPAFVRRPAHGE